MHSRIAGNIGTKQRSGYCASKHALHGFFDALRAETVDDGLRITLVCPGYIRTPISRHALGPDGQVHGKMDDNQASGMDPDVFTRQLLKAAAQEKEEVYMGGLETYTIYLKRFLPYPHDSLCRSTAQPGRSARTGVDARGRCLVLSGTGR